MWGLPTWSSTRYSLEKQGWQTAKWWPHAVIHFTIDALLNDWK